MCRNYSFCSNNWKKTPFFKSAVISTDHEHPEVMHISKVDSGRQYVGSKCICKRVCPGPACERRMLSCYIPPREAEQRRREIREPTKSIGTQWALSQQGQAAKREKGGYRQWGSQPVLSANSSVQSAEHPHSPGIWIPSGLRELRGVGWTKQFNLKSFHLIQTPFCSPGCGSSFHLMRLFGPGWPRKKLFPFLYTYRESLLPASCF